MAVHYIVAEQIGAVPSAVFDDIARRLPGGPLPDLLRQCPQGLRYLPGEAPLQVLRAEHLLHKVRRVIGSYGVPTRLEHPKHRANGPVFLDRR
jgi:hypothetical protein